MTNEELRKKLAAAFIDWCVTGGLSKCLDPVPLDELPADTIEITVDVRGTNRDERFTKAMPKDHNPDSYGPMLYLGVNALVDGKGSEQLGLAKSNTFDFIEVTPAEKA